MLKLTQQQVDALGGCAPCQATPPPPLAAAQAPVNAGPPGPSVEVIDPNKPSFILIELVERGGRAIAGAEFRVILPNGETVAGRLDAAGKRLIEGIDPGQCTVTFPGIDRRDLSQT